MSLPPYRGYTPGMHHGAPPSPPHRPWLWAIVGAIIGAAVTVLVGVALVVGGLVLVANEFMGDYTVLDGEVTTATEGPCDQLNATASSLSRFDGSQAGAAALGDVADDIDGILAAIDETRTTDNGALAWRDDLQDLADRVRDYADDLASGRTHQPDLGGQDGLLERLELGSPEGCEPPVALASLDPYYVSAW